MKHRAKSYLFVLSLLWLGITVHAAEEALTPENAYGPATAEIPKGGKEISEAEFRRLFQSKSLSLTSQKSVENEKKTGGEVLKQNQLYVRRVLANSPKLLERLTKKPNPGDKEVKPTEDGNYRISIRNTKGEKQDIITMGEDFLYGELANTLKQYPTQQNQLAVYSRLFDGLPEQYKKKKQLPAVQQVANLSAERLIQLNTSISRDLYEIIKYIPMDPKPNGYPGSCDKEQGYDSRATDQTGSSCEHHPKGIFATTQYPLKWYATCVKNQGNRGTCVSFGVTASVEAKTAVKYGKWMNMAEEDLYNKAKMTWYPSTYGDGLNTAGIVDDIKNRGYFFPFENAWNYNPSYSRTDDEVNMVYHNSCVGYTGPYCSNTNHQGGLYCSKIKIFNTSYTFCGYSAAVAGTSGIKATYVSQLWNPANPGLSTALIAIATLIKNPVTIALPVTPSFDGAANSGYATYVGAGEDNRGWHAVAVMGFVSNERLPAGAPKGDGGGYFIVKNSWGACWKDAGYIYLPYAWVQAYVGSASNLSNVN